MRKMCILLTMIFTFLLSSCNTIDTGMLGKITAPKNSKNSMFGTWEIYKYKPGSTKGMSEAEASAWVGKPAVFSEDVSILGGESCIKPIYKVKNVSSIDYLLYQYKVSPVFLDILDKSIQAVSITSGNQFFHEFIKTGEKESIVYINGFFFYLKKTSDNVDSELAKKYTAGIELEAGKENPDGSPLYSGVLLGLRSVKKTSLKTSPMEFEYRTLWISSENKNPEKVLSSDGLFVPRKNGFWNIGVEHWPPDKLSGDKLFAHPADKEIPEAKDTSLLQARDTQKTILYVGNNYVSTEAAPLPGGTGTLYLEVLPIDNIDSAAPIKISDIAGENGRNALYDGAYSVIEGLKGENRNLYGSPNEENFYLSRRNGHWIMRGRVSPIGKGNPFFDYNIKIIPPSRLVTYDDLCLSWNDIKTVVPDAIDAYTSPNRDMAIVLTATTLFVYTIENEGLSKSPSRKVQLRDKETAVMAEWCTGGYTSKWNNEFIKNYTVEAGE